MKRCAMVMATELLAAESCLLYGTIFYHEEHEVHEEKKDNYEIDERRETLRR